MEFGWLSIIPPLFAILLAIKSCQVFLSLFLGIVVGWKIISGGNILVGFELSIQSIVDVFKDAGNTRVVIFCTLVGALISLTQANGGVQGFVDLIQKKNIVTNRRRAAVFSFLVNRSFKITKKYIRKLDINGSIFVLKKRKWLKNTRSGLENKLIIHFK